MAMNQKRGKHFFYGQVTKPLFCSCQPWFFMANRDLFPITYGNNK